LHDLASVLIRNADAGSRTRIPGVRGACMMPLHYMRSCNRYSDALMTQYTGTSNAQTKTEPISNCSSFNRAMDTLGIEPKAFRILNGCDAITSCAPCLRVWRDRPNWKPCAPCPSLESCPSRMHWRLRHCHYATFASFLLLFVGSERMWLLALAHIPHGLTKKNSTAGS
jgi:hypothetical protein